MSLNITETFETSSVNPKLKNKSDLNMIKNTFNLNEANFEEDFVNTIMKDNNTLTVNDDNNNSITPIDLFKEKKPKYFQINNKKNNEFLLTSFTKRIDLKPHPEFKNKKKKVIFKNKFTDVVLIDNWKFCNRMMTFSNDDSSEQVSECEKCKEFIRNCNIF